MLTWPKKVFVKLFALCSVVAGIYQKESLKVQDPPCFFNPLCICSKAYPDLGRVTCKDFPLPNIPQQINASKVFILHLENNDLQDIEPYFFSGTGIFRLEISRNSLREIEKESFSGLERSLWELKLQNNKFRKVPSQSLRYLHKLKLLDLSDNQIRSIKPEDWKGLEDSLKILILSGNKLTNLRPETFSGLQRLEALDLSKNTLLELNVFGFNDIPLALTELNLSHNLLSNIPFKEISSLKQLRQLDLSFNLINDIDLGLDGRKGKLTKLLLDTLRLDYNQISYLPTESFKYFSFVNRTYLNGNPLRNIEKNAFVDCKIRELHLRDCELNELSSDSLAGIKDVVEVLDLQGNNFTKLPLNFFKEFISLKSLILKDNFIRKFDFENLFGDSQPNLDELDISCNQNSLVNIKTWNKLNNIRSLKISQFSESSLTSNDFPEFFRQLEEIEISYSNIKNLKNYAFKNIRGLRRLDLSENSISNIENEAFFEITHSLTHLYLVNGLSSHFTQLPPEIFKDMTNIEILDLSNNKLQVLSQKLFFSMKKLKMIFLHDNFIKLIPRETFQGDIHSELEIIQLSFNQLSEIESQTFTNLKNLRSLWLNDNRIKTIEKRAFTNLNQLKKLYLRGNKIMFLKEETFQNLPELEKLDLAYNMLKRFNYNCLDQAGTFSSFTLNLSRNNLNELSLNSSISESSDLIYINIKALDLSHNNISFIGPGFFKPIEPSITHLYLAHNRLRNITRKAFGNMIHLQWLDLSFNFLNKLEYDSLANTKSIQVFYLKNNYLEEIPKQFLKNMDRLRILDLSNNYLKSLPNNLFSDVILEKLYISNNYFTKLPLSSFDENSRKWLSHLDVSENAIMTLPSAEAFAKYQNLRWLNLSKNRLIRIEDGVFSYLNRLIGLDLSHNTDLILDQKGHTFYGLHDNLEDLSLKNLSLNMCPQLYLPSLISLDLSQNNIYTLSFEFPHNLSSLQKLELAENKLFKMPPAISGFANLEYIGVSGNPLQTVNFQQSFTLREVDLRNVSLGAIEKGALGKIGLLDTLKLSINESTQNLNFPHLLKDNFGLNHLYIEVLQNEGLSLMNGKRGSFSSKFRNLTLVSQALNFIPENLLRSVRSPIFNLALTNTSVKEIREGVFENGIKIRNLTLNLKFNKLNTVGNPNTADSPRISKKIFLTGFQVSNNDWICDCSIGWIEGWERKKRHYLCTHDSEECFFGSDDLRASVCSNKRSNTIAEIFKSELECGWNSSSKLKRSTVTEFLTIAFILPLITYYKFNLI